MKSIRSHILTGVVLSLTIVLVIGIVAIYSKARAILYSDFENALQEKALVISTYIGYSDEELTVEIDDKDFTTIGTSNNPLYYQIERENGQVLRKSRNLKDRKLVAQTGPAGQYKIANIPMPDGTTGRKVSFGFHPRIWDDLDIPRLPGNPPRVTEKFTLVVAASTSDVDSLVTQLFWVLMVIGGVVLIILPCIIYTIVWLGFKPLHQVANDIAQMDERDLSERIQTEPIPTEIFPIANRLNELLQRVESMVTRERSFSSDVAHELRTPLSGISSNIEVCLRKRRSTEQYIETLRVCGDICKQSQRMVLNLLAISRLENESSSVELEEFEFSKLAEECWDLFNKTRQHKNIRVNEFRISSKTIVSDKEKLRIVLRNLFENAVCHCNSDGEVSLVSSIDKNSISLTVENTGNKVHPNDTNLIFDRFWRGDKSRSKTGDHFGLGLFLVSRLCEALNAKISTKMSGEKFSITVSIPCETETELIDATQ